jgi:hypothetical protein
LLRLNGKFTYNIIINDHLIIIILYSLVSAKRVQQELERYTVKETAVNKQWIPVQKLFRLFSTRNWFAQKGIVWSTSRKKKRKKHKAGKEPTITKEEIRERVNYELKQRYTLARLGILILFLLLSYILIIISLSVD